MGGMHVYDSALYITVSVPHVDQSIDVSTLRAKTETSTSRTI